MRFVSYTQKPLHYQHSLSIQKIYKINSLEILRLKENIKEKACILREKRQRKTERKYEMPEANALHILSKENEKKTAAT